MKKKLCVMVLALFALAACQDKQPAPAQSSGGGTSPVAAAEKSVPVATAQPVAAKGNAVAVTKAPVSTTAQRMQEAAAQSHAAMAAQLQELKTTTSAASTAPEKSPVADKAAAVKATLEEAAATPPPAKAVAIKAKASVAAPVQHAATSAAAVSEKNAKKVTPAAPAQAVAMLGNAIRGKSIARKCQACHRFTDKRKVGPGLKGIVGRKAGMMPDMKYSVAVKAGGWIWNEQALTAWICDSKKAVKVLSGNSAAKTKMPAQHICDATKQADLMAFLKTL